MYHEETAGEFEPRDKKNKKVKHSYLNFTWHDLLNLIKIAFIIVFNPLTPGVH